MTLRSTAACLLPAVLAMALVLLPGSAKADRGTADPAPGVAGKPALEGVDAHAGGAARCATRPRALFDHVFQRLAGIASEGGDEAARRLALFDVFNRTFRTERLAKASLGRYWSEASAPMRARYLDLFHFYFMETYLPVAVRALRDRLDRLTVRDLGGGETVIALDIAASDGKAVPIRVHVAPAACGLGLLDVRIDGIRLSEILGAQFQSIARRQGLGALLDLLLVQARASPAWARWQARR